MNRLVLNASLAVLVAALALALYLGTEEDAVKPPLTALSPESIDRIRLTLPDAPPMRLEKTGSGWQLLQPVQAAADPSAVSALTALAATPIETVLDSGRVETSSLGLQPPRYQLQLNEQVIDFGIGDPLKPWRYARTDGRVVLVADPDRRALDADYTDLISRRLVPEASGLIGIETPGMQLSRDAQGLWHAAMHPELDAETLQATVKAWTAAEALRNRPAAKALSGPLITLHFADREPRTLMLLGREPRLTLADPALALQYELPPDRAAALLDLPKPATAAPAAASASPGAP